MDVANVDKLANDHKTMKYLLVRKDSLDRTVDAKGMKTKDPIETVRAFLTMITKKNRQKKANKGTEFAGEFKTLCKTEEIKTFSAMSETEAALADRTKPSSKNIVYLQWKIMDANKFIKYLNSSQPGTPEKNCYINPIRRSSRIQIFRPNLYSKPLRGFSKSKLKLDTVRIPKYYLPFTKVL